MQKEYLVLDARSSKRFLGTAEEPKSGVKKGRIPFSKNMPFEEVLSSREMKSTEDLMLIFNELNIENKKMIFPCATGITASILALSAEIVGVSDYVGA